MCPSHKNVEGLKSVSHIGLGQSGAGIPIHIRFQRQKLTIYDIFIWSGLVLFSVANGAGVGGTLNSRYTLGIVREMK